MESKFAVSATYRKVRTCGSSDAREAFRAKRHMDKKVRPRGHTEKPEKRLCQEEQGKKTASTSPKTYQKESTASWLHNQKYVAHHPATNRNNSSTVTSTQKRLP